jgi:hypothetical protein
MSKNKILNIADLKRKNYDYTFFWFSNTAIKHKISNVPPTSALTGLMILADNVQEITNKTGFILKASNVFRSQKINKIVGGSPTSAHCQGLAIDIISVELTAEEKLKNPNKKIPKTLQEICDLILSSGIKFDQLLIEKNNGCVHLGFKLNNKDNRFEVAYAYIENGVWKKKLL